MKQSEASDVPDFELCVSREEPLVVGWAFLDFFPAGRVECWPVQNGGREG